MVDEYRITGGSLPEVDDVKVVNDYGLPCVRGCRQDPKICERRGDYLGLGDKCGKLVVMPTGTTSELRPKCGGVWVYGKILVDDYQI